MLEDATQKIDFALNRPRNDRLLVTLSSEPPPNIFINLSDRQQFEAEFTKGSILPLEALQAGLFCITTFVVWNNVLQVVIDCVTQRPLTRR